ncbi:uncharacterized protein [Battus philenor]|uniref:uncharacterized protein n=1 Tax=Battus philenor TaxID=42288 RepID=UPI0035D12F97
MSKVKLAIRIRPFTEKELKSEKDRVAVIRVKDEHTVTITNMKVNSSGAGDSRERVRPHYADYIFNSICHDTNAECATQEKIFHVIGQEVLSSISQGLSACVLAYGQSATGKTYTMMGTDSKPGLIPRLCHALAEEEHFDVKVSFLEIYNEKVHDLLVGEAVSEPNAFNSLPRRKGNARKDLRVREHPSKGPYVQNLRRVCVRDINVLLALVSEGARRRRTAATRRNPASSRSHALLEISTLRATIHLADLAGSERAGWEGFGASRQKEGANINKSLVALSNVISALVSGGNGRSRFVPYRDSALTWLLKDCFTGGGNIFVIATLSPSAACYSESAFTLRWASQARRLQATKPVSKTGVTSKVALQTQLDQLISELKRHHIRYIAESGKISYDDDHWALSTEYKNSKIGSTQTLKIGNITSMQHPKNEEQYLKPGNASTASVSSDGINTLGKNVKIAGAIGKEVDKLFGPTLERTRSGSALEVIAPLRHKRRQYYSQEILPNDISLLGEKIDPISQRDTNISHNTDRNITKKGSHVPILYDNQRAEIIASVTERLYSKFKKEAGAQKMESMVDKNIMQPLSELKICTNARQRLMELSQKAMRNKRRIGIPAYTQTRKIIIRVKDQEINVQTDLAPYSIVKSSTNIFYRDVATETLPLTPRYKEVAIGDGSLNFHDKSTTMELKNIVKKSTYAMTEVTPKINISTQTKALTSNKRRRLSSKAIKKRNQIKSKYLEKRLTPSVININISPVYSLDSDSVSTSESEKHEKIDNKIEVLSDTTAVPLTNFSSTEDSTEVKQSPKYSSKNNTKIGASTDTVHENNNETFEDFPEDEFYPLPRVSIATEKAVDYEDIKNMILGRNMNLYPYNIALSPSKENEKKRIIKFKDPELNNLHYCGNNVLDEDHSEKEYYTEANISSGTFSNISDSSKMGSTSFVWEKETMSTIPSHADKYSESILKNKANSKNQNAEVCNDCFIVETDLDFDIDLNNVSADNFRRNQDQFWTRRHVNRTKDRVNILPNISNKRCKYDSFDSIENKLVKCCNTLEKAASNYECYLDKYNKGKDYPKRSPTEYLQYLVNLRREVVKESISTGSTGTISSD